jgi:hypothetical protein
MPVSAVNVIDLEQNRYRIHLHPQATALDVKNAVHGSGGPPVEQQRLIYRGRLVVNTAIIDEVVQGEEDKTLHLVVGTPPAPATAPAAQRTPAPAAAAATTTTAAASPSASTDASGAAATNGSATTQGAATFVLGFFFFFFFGDPLLLFFFSVSIRSFDFDQRTFILP